MKTIAQIISWAALAATILTPMVYLGGKMPLETMKLWLNVATVVWFIATPLWMERGET
jgi:hypothetical protein